MNVMPPDEPEDVIDMDGTEPAQEPNEKKAKEEKTQDSTLLRANPNIINK